MRGAFKIFSFRGINVFIHWTFLFLVGWVIMVNARTGNDIEQLTWSIIFLLAVFTSIALHELGHALMASRYGIKARNMVLLPIGGIASIERFPGNPKQELMISLAGPAVNILIALLLLPFIQAYPPFWDYREGVSIMHGHDLFYTLHLANIGLALLNLIPAFPLDGGRILRALLGFKINYVRATNIAEHTGRIIAVALIAAGIVFSSLLPPLIGIFIIFSAGMEEYYLRLKALAKDIKLMDILMYDYNSIRANTTVKEAAGVLMNNHSKYFVVMEGAHPVGSINRMEIVKAIAEKNYDEPIGMLLRKELTYLDGDQPVDSVLEKLAENDERIYPVMENNQFTGVVNFNHVIEYLLLHKADSKDYDRIKSLSGLI
jgi:Zn-dependent protease/predicted transcriptional regulator